MFGSNEMNPNADELQIEEPVPRRGRDSTTRPASTTREGRHLSAKGFFNDIKKQAKAAVSNMTDEIKDQWDEFKTTNSDNFD